MTQDEVLQIFRDSGAMIEGHFVLSSGLRSPLFLQKALVFSHPERTERLCRALAQAIRAADLGPIDLVVSPAVGGIIPGYETARHLGVPALYVEREDGEFRLRRGFRIEPAARVVVVEDIISTGLSSRECIDCVRALGAEVLACACLVDRSAGEADVGVPVIALARFKVPAYPPDQIPAEMAAIPPVKPGSRGLA